MARKTEVGIEYFPMNTDIIHNPKVKLLVAEFGSRTTWAVLLPLYCKIYREKGYWIDWHDEDSKLLFAQDECKLELSVVNEFVNGCLRRSLFDKVVFEMFGVLTSDRIQENYCIAKYRVLKYEIIDEFLLVSQDVYSKKQNVNIVALNVDIIKKKVNAGTQKKKEKKILEEEGDSAAAVAYTDEEKVLFSNFQTFIKDKAPNVSRMKDPFTIEEYLKLKKQFNAQEIKDMLMKMHNWKDLVKKNVSSYLTFLNWSKKDFNFSASEPARNISANLSQAVKSIENGQQIQKAG